MTNELMRLRGAGLGGQRKAIAAVVIGAREQLHALALALDDQAIIVMLNSVDPVGAGAMAGAIAVSRCAAIAKTLGPIASCEGARL